MSTRGVTTGQAELSAPRAPAPLYTRPRRNVIRGFLLALACAALSVLPVAPSTAAGPLSRAPSGAATFPPYPAKCPLTTKFVYGTSCLVDEGLRPCLRGSSPGCTAVTVGPGSAWNYFLPVVNGNLHPTTSTMTVPIGASVTVHASVAAPACTYALLNAPGHPRCWDNLTFGGSTYYMPTNYNGEFMPPRLSFPSSCAVEGETSRHNPMSCTAKVLPPFGGRVLPRHYVVVVVEVEVNRGGTLAGGGQDLPPAPSGRRPSRW